MIWIVSLMSAASAFSQSSIAGSAKDTSGALLPGVTVEASGPALIERVRTVFTDNSGQYKIVDLPPGVYSVSFTLSGFSTTKFDGIDLPANFTAGVNAEMRVGALEETVTVTGQSPVVDVHNATQTQVLREEVLRVLPTAQNYEAHMALVPAVRTGNDVGGSNDLQQTGVVTAYGGRAADLEIYLNGMPAAILNGSSYGVQFNDEGVQEVVVQIAAGNAEQRSAGVQVDQIPKQGGNQFHGHGIAKFAVPKLQSDNITKELQDRGLTNGAARINRQWDMAPSFGGPIKRDRLWFFTAAKNTRVDNNVPNVFYADGRQGVDDQSMYALTGRLTGQINRALKATAFYEKSPKFRGHRFLEGGTVTPEASIYQTHPFAFRTDVKVSYAPTSKLLAEAGFAETHLMTGQSYQPSVKLATCFTAFRLCPPGTDYGDIAKTELTTGITRNAYPSGPATTDFPTLNFMASASYVTGSHAFKVGVQQRWGEQSSVSKSNGDIVQRYRNGVADSVIIRNTPINIAISKANFDLGLYVQDSWTINRLTVSPGLRYDYLKGEIPAQQSPAGRFVGVRNFAGVEPPNVPKFKNFSPRFGAAYDLFGNSRTGIKASVGKYVQQESAAPGTYNPLLGSTDTRRWTDNDLNDIASEDELGPSTNTSFGIRRNTNPDPDLKRPYQIFYLVGVQHELMRGLSLATSYVHRRYYRLYWTDNLATTAADYTLVNIPDPRGNGGTLPVYNLSAAKLGLIDERVKNSSQNRTTYSGLDLTVTGRLGGGRTATGGFSTGRTISVLCEQDDPNNLRFCDERDFDKPLRTDAKFTFVSPLPRGFMAGVVFQSIAGDPYERCGLNYSDFGVTLFTGPRTCVSYQVSRTQVPTLSQTQVLVRLSEPGSLYVDRINQLDINLRKSMQVGRVRVTPRIDLYNSLNVSPVLDSNTTYGPALGTPINVLNPRVVHVALEMAF